MSDQASSDNAPTEQTPTGDDGLLQESQQAIDEAKAAAADVVEPDEDDLIAEDVPVADDAEPADGPAPAA